MSEEAQDRPRFGDLSKRAVRKQGVCPVCDTPMPRGTERGRVQIVVTGITYEKVAPNTNYNGESKATHKQQTRAIASDSRIVCESCAVELYMALRDRLPVKMERSDRPS